MSRAGLGTRAGYQSTVRVYYVCVTLLMLYISRVHGYETICNGTVVGDNYYEVQTLLKNFGKSYNLVMHELSGSLFFSHSYSIKNHFTLKIVSCHLGSGVCTNVSGVNGGYAVYLDRKPNRLYFGGEDGIYQYNFQTKNAYLIGAKNKAIWCIFVIKGAIFYIEYPSHKLYSLNERGQTLAVGLRPYEYYFVSRDLVHYFTNKRDQLYKRNNTTRFDVNPILLSLKIKVKQIVEDSYGRVFICAKDGVYVDNGNSVQKIGNFKRVFGMTIVNHRPDNILKRYLNIIYSDSDAIHKAFPTHYSDYCLLSIAAARKKVKKKRTQSNKNLMSLLARIDYE